MYPNSQSQSLVESSLSIYTPIPIWGITNSQTEIGFPYHQARESTMKRHRESEGARFTNGLTIPDKTVSSTFPEEVFECRTCKRKFSSFQALGGHRASHKRLKLQEKEHHQKAVAKSLGLGTPSEPKLQKCFICGEGFSLGQALEGHMRRHRAAASNEVFSSINQVVAKVSVLKRSCNDKVFCLDLNLTPLQNDLNFLLFGKVSPKINLSCF